MKKLILSVFVAMLSFGLFAQAPQKMSYQAVVRDANNTLVASQTVGMQISILQGGISGNLVYAEIQTPTTNANGLVSIDIGLGTLVGGDFLTIDWANGPYFIKTETDPDGGTNYSISGISQLMSVPYAFHAKTAENVIGGMSETDPHFNAWDKDYNDLINKPIIPTVPSNVSAFSNDAGYITSYTETDPQFNAWNKDYNDLINKPAIPTAADGSETKITAGSNVTVTGSGTTASPYVVNSKAPDGTAVGEMLYWDGTAWVNIAPGQEGYVLKFIEGKPMWKHSGINILHNGFVYNEVTNPTTGKTWLDRNLGAAHAAISSTDANSYGDLYQWGRGTDGHEKRAFGLTYTLSTSDNPGHGIYILTSSSPWDWRSPQNNNLWQGVGGINNPCPVGFRLPTQTEFENERLSWATNNANGAFGSPLKLPVAGVFHGEYGMMLNTDYSGFYWTSTVNGNDSIGLAFDIDSGTNNYNRSMGFSVRCIKD